MMACEGPGRSRRARDALPRDASGGLPAPSLRLAYVVPSRDARVLFDAGPRRSKTTREPRSRRSSSSSGSSSCRGGWRAAACCRRCRPRGPRRRRRRRTDGCRRPRPSASRSAAYYPTKPPPPRPRAVAPRPATPGERERRRPPPLPPRRPRGHPLAPAGAGAAGRVPEDAGALPREARERRLEVRRGASADPSLPLLCHGCAARPTCRLQAIAMYLATAPPRPPLTRSAADLLVAGATLALPPPHQMAQYALPAMRTQATAIHAGKPAVCKPRAARGAPPRKGLPGPPWS